MCLFEIGRTQAEAVSAMIRERLAEMGIEGQIFVRKDLAGWDRLVGFHIK